MMEVLVTTVLLEL